ncbi:hypothetical protein Tcan_17866 [Toxocara canis]|uniref:Uncharacterized protein n=1 Tax=Toxocara canis TaxID=6265 RepID=A0A0B2V5Y6_TOXCA|nr:hypothetical protein Tcan_17866 [Toxocara canis]
MDDGSAIAEANAPNLRVSSRHECQQKRKSSIFNETFKQKKPALIEKHDEAKFDHLYVNKFAASFGLLGHTSFAALLIHCERLYRSVP